MDSRDFLVMWLLLHKSDDDAAVEDAALEVEDDGQDVEGAVGELQHAPIIRNIFDLFAETPFATDDCFFMFLRQ